MESSIVTKVKDIFDLAEKYEILEVYPAFMKSAIYNNGILQEGEREQIIAGNYAVSKIGQAQEYVNELIKLLGAPPAGPSSVLTPGFRGLPFPEDIKAIRLPDKTEDIIKLTEGKINLIYVYLGDEEDIDDIIGNMIQRNPSWNAVVSFIGINVSETPEKAIECISKMKKHEAVHYWMPGGILCELTKAYGKVPPAYYLVHSDGKMAMIENLWGSYPEEHIEKLLNGKKAEEIIPMPYLKEKDYTYDKIIEDIKGFIQEFDEDVLKSQHFVILFIYADHITRDGEVIPTEGFLSAVMSYDSKDEAIGEKLKSQIMQRFNSKMLARCVLLISNFRNLELGDKCSNCSKEIGDNPHYLCVYCDPPVYFCSDCANLPEGSKDLKEPIHHHPLYHLNTNTNLNNVPDKIKFITDPLANAKYEYSVCARCSEPIEGLYWKCLTCCVKNLHLSICKSCTDILMEDNSQIAVPATPKFAAHQIDHVCVRETYPEFLHEMSKP